jgi:hypothetical protein
VTGLRQAFFQECATSEAFVTPLSHQGRGAAKPFCESSPCRPATVCSNDEQAPATSKGESDES